MRDASDRIDFLVGDHAQKLSERLQAHRAQLFPPDAKRELRKFTSGEAAALLGVKDAYLRKLHLDGRGPSPEVRNGGRRYYSPADLQALRIMLESGTNKPGTYLPGRRDGDHLQVITVINFKGGSGKTTTAAHLAQKMALDGYKVLAIDLDPQASLSALHGFQPEFDLLDGGTLYDAIRYDAPVPIADVIQKTYFTNLDIIPGNLDLMEFEHDTPRALLERDSNLFFTRVGDALATVEKDYDVVVIDCPPQLGYLTMVGFMRNMFGEHVLNHSVLKSTAISDAGITKQTLYEVEKGQFTRSTYERAMESLNAVNGEIENLVQTAWGRTHGA